MMEKFFRNLDFTGIHNVLTYAALEQHREFDPAACVNWLKTSHELQTIAWPKTNPEDNSMEAVSENEQTFFKSNSWGIQEPQNGEIVNPLQFDMVLVPLLVFDTKGYRVGYGKGFYDRFFARCRKNVLKIGFSFFEPVVKVEDIDQFDVPLSHCITPSGIYEF